MATLQRGCLTIAHCWDGVPIGSDEAVTFDLVLSASKLELSFDAPYHGDPAPPAPIGRTDGLWNHEVVELFLLGDDGHYIELEFGPAGHHLALRLHGARAQAGPEPSLDYRSSLQGGRWRGEAGIEVSQLPAGLRACNGYAIHGQGPARRYLAAYPVPGTAVDFHRLDRFGKLPWSS